MHLQCALGSGADGGNVVSELGTVGCPHLNEYRSALLENGRDAKRAADLHEFSSRDDRFASRRDGIQDEYHGCCGVGHDESVFCAGDLGE